MLIETEIIFTDMSQSDIMGHEVNKTDQFIFDLSSVSGIMPGDESQKTSILFLEGKDVLVNLPFKPLIKKYMKVKDCSFTTSDEG